MSTDGRWVVCPERLGGDRLRLVCLPHAGAGVSAFSTWTAPAAEAGVELALVRLPGRETRAHEQPIGDLSELVPRLLDGIRDELVPPFAVYGHCSGALVAYELVRRLRDERGPRPAALFVSGRGAPTAPARARLSELPEDALVAELLRWGGASREVLEEPNLRRLLLPAVRADFALGEAAPAAGDVAVDCPLVAIAGTEDDQVPPAALAEWERCAGAGFSLCAVRGGHFFIWQSERAVMATIRSSLP